MFSCENSEAFKINDFNITNLDPLIKDTEAAEMDLENEIKKASK